MATPEHPESRPQAGPLPSKRGEIGYEEGVHGSSQQEQAGEGSGTAETSPLPERHPADTPVPTQASQGPSTSTPDAAPADSPSTANPPNTSAPLNPSGITGQKFASFLSCKRIPTLWGMRVTTLSLFAFQLGILGATIGGWIVLIQRMQAAQANDQQSGQNNNGGMSMGSALIFVYVAFAMLTLLQIVFLERCSFRLRAERYAYLHPGEVLPTHRDRGQPPRNPGIAFVPWNRQPLPTYAATLAQSGVGTGDVEDNIIAQAPPPAYGEHRTSQLLLRGEIPEQLRAERLHRSAVSRRSTMSWLNIRRISVRDTGGDGPRIPPDPDEDRPKSYMSTDPDWEAALDADRAAVLEETLAKLEEGEDHSATTDQRRK
ncbi:hypothetical protein DAEQUDRAFT_729299 [Daedalea quercina L-15889]|uniref:Uncharacterized protein n=1 Tax=Daedalea quercina L-15889 TaxID=1314783 RepID=A0A165NR19_9APHY|nr:hypothetical protein DAEQUDRAFT_729299 [Daedalea quercina L-15889]